jgi:hypothetical protein
MKLALALLLSLAASPFAQSGYPKLAPFEGVRWRTEDRVEHTEVRLEGRWYELLELDGQTPAAVLAFSEAAWPHRGKKRFGEDLVEVLSRMGSPPGSTMTLLLRDPVTGDEVLRVEDMTREKRQSVRLINHGQTPEEILAAPRRPLRPLVEAPDPRYAFLAMLVPGRGEDTPTISTMSARGDLAELEALVEERYAYRDLTGVDREAAFDALHRGLARAGDVVRVTTFTIALQKLLALFGDGHARVGSGLRSVVRRGYAGYLLGETADGLVAFRGDRSGLVDEEHPYVVALDGLDVERWIEAAQRLEPLGSPQLRRRRAIRNLRYVAHLRVELARPSSQGVELTLRDEAGETVRLELPLEDRRAPSYGLWPAGEHRRLPGDIGYLKLPSMDEEPEFLDGLVRALESFRDTQGLVIDVRGNGGGSRHALLTLLPYFLRPEEGPVVVNVARFRFPPNQSTGTGEGYLANRFLYPASWSGWEDGDREAITALEAGFEPAWDPGEGFSAWHHLVVRPAGDDRYEAPVVVLCDSDCYSATDVFLGAFADRTGATLMGTPSSGGSARSLRYRLPASGLVVRLASMASFRPDGRTYDGVGVEVDLEVLPIPTDFTGETDSVLAAALARLLE